MILSGMPIPNWCGREIVKASVRKSQLQKAAIIVKPSMHSDYRKYLLAIYEAMKRSCAPYSYLLFAEDLGFSPSNMIRLAIAGKRDLAPKTARTIAASLGLDAEERKYFIHLVSYQAARSAQRRDQGFDKLLSAKKRSAGSGGEWNAAAYFEHWYHPVVRELLRVKGFISGPDFVAESIFPRISAEQARSSLELLVAIGQARFDQVHNGYVPDGPDQISVPSDEILHHLIALKYHKEMLGVAAQAIDELSEARRELNSLTLTLSAEAMELLRYRLRDFCRSAIELDAKSASKRHVIQLNFQLMMLASADEGVVRQEVNEKETGS
jgi:uncharacterized protein (TIGR02147 family)